MIRVCTNMGKTDLKIKGDPFSILADLTVICVAVINKVAPTPKERRILLDCFRHLLENLGDLGEFGGEEE